MNYAIILAGGTGERMRQGGMPKQFLEVYGKPIIVYTLEAFEQNEDIGQIVIPCNREWIGHLTMLIEKYQFQKIKHIMAGGQDRMGSIVEGFRVLEDQLMPDDIVMIHDGVRPLICQETIRKNVETAAAYGDAMTVHANTETVVVTRQDSALWEDFKNREITYTLTSPQSFRAKELLELIHEKQEIVSDESMPLRDISLVYAKLGKRVHLVVEDGRNMKITTPEDYYYLKAYLELQESKHILGV